MKTILSLMCAALLGAGLVPIVSAQTDGSVTFNVQLFQDGGSYKPKHVVAVWVVNPSGAFIKTVWKDGTGWTGEGTSHLTQWQAARASSTVLDGHSGATITTYNAMTVTWNCRDAASALVADGAYKFYVEFTEGNSTGPYSGAISWTKSSSVYSNSYPDQTYIKNMKVVFTPTVLPHDIAVSSIAPNAVPTNTTAIISVAVTNKTSTLESFSVVLSNLTTASLIRTQQVSALAGNTLTNVSFSWNTTNLLGNYILQATAGPVSNETVTADNTLSASVSVQYIPHDIAVTSMSPTLAPPNTNWTINVGVTNQTGTTESFSVVLSNLTTSSLIRTQQITALAGSRGTNVALAWSTTNLLGNYVLRATAGPVAGESLTDDNTLSASVTVRPMLHDLGLLAALAPPLVLPNTTNIVTILATNQGDFSESFSLNLYDDTDVRLISSSQVSSLSPAASTNLTATWRTTNCLYGYHTLRAVANPVAGETNLVNNTNTANTVVADGWGANAYVIKGSTWRYNDQGLDFTQTPWSLATYYDSVWSQGPAPLGYSENGLLAGITTRLSWGSTPTNKNPACYFRQEFSADLLPSSLTLNVRCVDGVVLYLNGGELARFNMPAGPVSYTSLAAAPVSGADQYTYFSSNAVPTNMVFGRNVLAAEVHKASLAASDAVLDVEMLGVVPQFPPTHRVDAIALTTDGDALAGDQMPVTVTLTNRGSATESVLVVLKNNTTGQILGSQTLTGLHPTGSATVTFGWGTLGASGGANNLVAYTVVGGVTNLAGASTNAAIISGSGFSTNLVNATASIGGSCSSLTTAGNLLVVAAGATLEVWDRSNGPAPARIGTVRLPGLIQDVVVSGSYAYAACGSAGVQFVDLSYPSLPLHRLTYNSSGHAWALAVSGNYLYVADGVAGLRILNIANPTAPSLAGAYYTAGPARAVALSGTRACLLDQHQGLLVLDVSNPAAPALLGACADVVAGQSLAVSGANACVVDGNNHFCIVNLANPAAPTLTSSLLLAGKVGQAVAVNGSTAYVAAGGDGLLIIDVTTPSAPTFVSSIPMSGQASALALSGANLLYVAEGLAGFQVFDVTAPNNPALQANYPTALRAADVVVTTNDLAYVAGGESGLQIFSVANPLSPKLLSRFTGVTNARAVAVSGTTAYVGDGQYGLKIVNVADPLAPSLLGAYSSTNLGTIRNVGASGSLVVISDGRTVSLVDASNPASPVLGGTYASTNFIFSLAVDNAKAYLACGSSGFQILNMAPGAFNVLGGYSSISLPVTGISVVSNTAYIAYGTKAWRIFDVSNPGNPLVMKTFMTQGPILDLAAAGTNLTLISPTNSMALTMDLSVPLTPVQTPSLGPLARVLHLSASPTMVMTAEDEVGLAIFSTKVPLVLYAQRSGGNAAFNLRWYSVAGKTYTIYKSTDLKAGFSVLKDNIVATPPLNVDADSMASPTAFYIIGVR